MTPTVTLLICTSGRAVKLRRCLASVASGSEKPDQVVVVNGNDDETPVVVESFRTEFSEVLLLRHPNRNLATLRNLGLPHCGCDLVAMTDDDAVPSASWIEVLKRGHMRFPEAGCIGGPVRGLSTSFVSQVADAVVFPAPKAGSVIYTLPTVNAAYKRSVINQVGEFDATLFRGEDVDYNWRVLQSGHVIQWDPAMQVVHEHRATMRGLFQQQWMYGRAYYLVRSKWPAMYCVYPHSLRSFRSWAKLAHCGLAILYQPWALSRALANPSDRIRAYPALVIHHLIWKLGMLYQALPHRSNREASATQQPVIERWRNGQPMASVHHRDA